MDLVGPLPLKDINTNTIVQIFMREYVSRFGVPLTITTDRGTQFTSKLFSDLVQSLGSHKIHTNAYHPQSNGMVERFHRQLKASLMASNNTMNWYEELPLILLGFRSTIKDDIECTPSELVYGQTLRIPGELVVKEKEYQDQNAMLSKLREYFDNVRSSVIHHGTNKSYIPKNMFDCKYVFVKVLRPSNLQAPYEGPYKVIEKTNKTFKILKGNQIKSVSIDLIKPANITNDVVEQKDQNIKKQIAHLM